MCGEVEVASASGLEALSGRHHSLGWRAVDPVPRSGFEDAASSWEHGQPHLKPRPRRKRCSTGATAGI
eukprot:15452382-Alexandrium_andersonii.AAC.1